MAPARSSSTTTPFLAPEVEAELKRLGLTWKMEAQYDLRTIAGRAQVRDIKNLAPKANVASYAVQMGEKPFPAIVLSSDGYVIDGNTRIAARAKRKEHFCSAAVLDLGYHHATPTQKAELHALAATLNQLGAERLKPNEVRRIIEDLLDLDWSNENIARSVGASPSTASQVRRERAGRDRLASLGLDPNDFDESSTRVLGSPDAMSLNDAPFKALAELTLDAGFKTKEVQEVARAMKALGADKLALDHVAKFRKDQASRIKQHRLTGKGKPPMASQVRRSLGIVVKNNPADLVEVNPTAMDSYRDLLDKAINVLSRTMDMQDARIEARDEELKAEEKVDA